VDTLLKAVHKEFEQMAKTGPAVTYLDKVKKQWKEEHKTNFKENGVWLNQLLQYKLQGGDPNRFVKYETFVDRLTVKDVQQAANLVFNGKNAFTAILMPENYSNKNASSTEEAEENALVKEQGTRNKGKFVR